MRYNKLFLIVVFLVVNSFFVYGDCVTPTDGMYITEDTVFCFGTYNRPNGVVISQESNIDLDCNGATLIGPGGSGIQKGVFVYNSPYTIVKNCNIQNYPQGIYVSSGSSNSQVTDNTITGGNYPLQVYKADNTQVKRNTLSSANTGLIIDQSSSVIVEQNQISGHSSSGIVMGSSYSGANIRNNNFASNSFNIQLSSSIDVSAESNWWGASDESSIQAKIFDKNDNSALGIVDYDPWLCGSYPGGSTSPCSQCTCGSWQNNGCGGSCPSNQMHQTRTCTPSGCNTESQCVNDASCQACSCTDWGNWGCGVGGCQEDELYYTRTCTPSGCNTEHMCSYYFGCEPECDETDNSCGTYPDCNNCDLNDSCYGASYRDYGCESNQEGCGYIEYDCSTCICGCGGYNTIENVSNGNCNDCKDNDCDGLTDYEELDCREIECYSDSDCPPDGYYGNTYCFNNVVYYDYLNWKCTSPGTYSSSCDGEAIETIQEVCAIECSEGQCIKCHCSNNYEDSDEEGVDCGGADCKKCPDARYIFLWLPYGNEWNTDSQFEQKVYMRSDFFTDITPIRNCKDKVANIKIPLNWVKDNCKEIYNAGIFDCDKNKETLLASNEIRKCAEDYAKSYDIDIEKAVGLDAGYHATCLGVQRIDDAVYSQLYGPFGQERLEIPAHELGHAYGLCDEYNYDVWNKQNGWFNWCPNTWDATGCPNGDSNCHGSNPYINYSANYITSGTDCTTGPTYSIYGSPISNHLCGLSAQSYNHINDDLNCGSKLGLFLKMVITLSLEKNKAEPYDIYVVKGNPIPIKKVYPTDYRVTVYDKEGSPIDEQNVYMSDFYSNFGGSGAESNGSLVTIEFNYSDSYSFIKVFDNETVILEQNLTHILCNKNKICDENENYFSCPHDCPSGSSDGICDGMNDSFNDLDCADGKDPDYAKSLDFSRPSKIFANYYNDYPDLELASGKIHLVWLRPIGDAIYYSFSQDRGNSWYGIRNISSGTESLGNPIIRANGNYLHVFWYKGWPNYDGIIYSKSEDNGLSWSTQRNITSGPIVLLGDAAVEGSNVFLVWMKNQGENNNKDLYFGYSNNNGTDWSESKRLTFSSNHSYSPKIAVKDNHIYLAWIEILEEGIQEIYFMKSDDRGITWSKAKRITFHNNSCSHPNILVESNAIYIIWKGVGQDEEGIYIIKSEDGSQTWSSEKKISDQSLEPTASISSGRIGILSFNSSIIQYNEGINSGSKWSDDYYMASESMALNNSPIWIKSASDENETYFVWIEENSTKQGEHGTIIRHDMLFAKMSRCVDNDGDGFNKSKEGCGIADCNDNNASIHPPASGLNITKDTLFCSGTYNLSDGIIIGANNITLDCNDAILFGNNTGKGVKVEHYNHTTIKNCELRNFSYGIYLYYSNNNKIVNNTVESNSGKGIELRGSENNSVLLNKVDSNEYGIRIFADHNYVAGNLVEFNSKEGIYLTYARSNIVSNNIIRNNTGDGIYIIYSPSNDISSNNLSLNQKGVSIFYSNLNQLRNNNIFSNRNNGVTVFGSNNTYIINNSVWSNNIGGIAIGFLSYNSSIINNEISENGNSGVTLDSSYFSNISSNDIYLNKQGIYCWNALNNSISHNNIFNNTEYNFYNYQLSGILAEYNYWGTTDCNEIDNKIYDDEENTYAGEVVFEPFLDASYPYGQPVYCKIKFNILLTKGWNLISIPLNSTNKSINSIFSNINYSKIFSYNGTWLYYYNETKYNFADIDESLGYWISSLNSQTIEIEGTKFNNLALNLNQGWNLIGYPILNQTNISEFFKDINITTAFAYNG
ncbi:MAG: right-handed parallel beta-helix repeat-containing protein, partial [Nanoarchaeota archaeon]|nr:right-handed parallel beta-helix repeat-containing protein [Nanoarchaeota archaeon]